MANFRAKLDHMETEERITPRRNVFSIAGLVFGILSIFTASLGIAPILALIFGSIGLSKANDTGQGRLSSWIGLILGIVYFLVFLYHQGFIR